jgi:glycosyltransferase involved in cell wall biosynthesis
MAATLIQTPDRPAAIPSLLTGTRPIVSVVIPVYEPDDFLIDTLKSVLASGMGRDDMQIAIVDDASPTRDVARLIAQVGAVNRFELHRADRNRGLAGNWNRCLELARGRIVHVLHQDDIVAPDYYRRMLPAFARNPAIGMAFCRHAFVDERNRTQRVSHRERLFAGTLRNWLPKIAEWQRIQCPAALVRRDVYEQIGGYRPDLYYALDWEMWVRIAAQFPVWYEPRVLARYRRHASSETNRLRSMSRLDADVLKAIETFADSLPTAQRSELASRAYAAFAFRALRQLRDSGGRGHLERLKPVRIAVERVTHSRRSIRQLQAGLREAERLAQQRQMLG